MQGENFCFYIFNKLNIFLFLKQSISILLTLLMFLNASSYILIYVGRLATHRWEINAVINSQWNSLNIQELKFTREEYESKLRWKDEKEFEYNGRMYDIASVKETGDNIIVYCVRDEKEEVLISNYEKLHRTNSTKDKIASDSQTLLLAFHFLAIQNESCKLDNASNALFIPSGGIDNYNSIYIKFPTPPPKIV